MSLPLYFDYAATTPVDPRVRDKMMNFLTMDGCFGNPASNTHPYGWQAKQAVELAREQIAELIHAPARAIIFTSGATESDNLAIKGSAYFHQQKGNHLITSAIEHQAVLDSYQQLAKEGFDITFIQPTTDGLLPIERLKAAIRKDTILISIMQVNNEIGVIQNIQEIAALARAHGILSHTDAAQSVGKMPIDVEALGIDLLSISAHKIYGPKGIGALFIRQNPLVRLQELMHGGRHERGLRSGTLPTHQIVGFGEAAQLCRENLAKESDRLWNFRRFLVSQLKTLEGIYLNGCQRSCIPGILNFSVEGVAGETLLLNLRQIAVSSGSACSSTHVNPSHVLNAIQLPLALVHNTIRLSFGRMTTEKDIQQAVQILLKNIQELRK